MIQSIGVCWQNEQKLNSSFKQVAGNLDSDLKRARVAYQCALTAHAAPSPYQQTTRLAVARVGSFCARSRVLPSGRELASRFEGCATARSCAISNDHRILRQDSRQIDRNRLSGRSLSSSSSQSRAWPNVLPATGLRFFAVYGPWGRPYMAMCDGKASGFTVTSFRREDP